MSDCSAFMASGVVGCVGIAAVGPCLLKIEEITSVCVAPPGEIGIRSESKLESLRSRCSRPSIVKLSHLSPLTIHPRKGGIAVRSSSEDPVDWSSPHFSKWGKREGDRRCPRRRVLRYRYTRSGACLSS
jgi:hypothetical protein